MVVLANSLNLLEAESGSLLALGPRAPGVYYAAVDLPPGGFLSTLLITAVAGGGAVGVSYFDFTTGDIADEEPYATKGHAAAGAPGKTKAYFRAMHTKVVAKVTVTGAPVTFGLYVSAASGPDDPAAATGETLAYADVVTTADTDLPPVAAGGLTQVFVRAGIDQPAARRLLVSVNGGGVWVTLRPGESFSGDFPGDRQQVKIKAAASTVGYEAILVRKLT